MAMTTIKVKLPSGQIQPVKVPDDWDNEQIVTAMRKHFPGEYPESKNSDNIDSSESPEPKERTGLMGVGADVAQALQNKLSSTRKFAQDLPDNLQKAGDYIEENPGTAQLHMLGQLGAEAGEIGKGLVNTPYDVANYLLKKQLHPAQLLEGSDKAKKPIEVRSKEQLGKNLEKATMGSFIKNLSHQLINTVSKNLPHIPENTGVEKALGLEADPEKGDALIRAVPDIAALGLGGRQLIKGGKEFLTAPSKNELFERALQKQIEEAEAAHDLSKEQVKQLQEALTLQYSDVFNQKMGKATPTKIKESINVKKGKLKELEPITQIPEEKIPEIPAPPDTKEMIANHKAAMEKAQEAVQENLGVLDHPTKKVGGKINERIKDLHRATTHLYQQIRNHYIDKQIMANNSAEIKAATDALEKLKNSDDLAPGYGSGGPQQKQLEEKINALKGEKVNASDVFDVQKSMEKIAQDIRKKQYSGVNQLEFNRLNSIADALESQAENLSKRLEEVGGDDIKQMMKQANKGWKTYKDLTKKNPIGKAALKENVSPSTLLDLADAHPGNEFLNALIKKDSELRKDVLAAYVGKSNVKTLLRPDTLTKQYLQSLPRIDKHVTDLKNAIADYKEGKAKASKVQQEHAQLVESIKEVAQRQEMRQKAIKESETIKKQIDFLNDAVRKTEEEMKKANLTGEQLKTLQKTLNDHKTQLKDKNNRLKKLGSLILKLKGAAAFGRKIGL